MYIINIICYHYRDLTDIIHSKYHISYMYPKEVHIRFFSEYISNILEVE